MGEAPYPKVERPQVGRIKQRAERSNHKINLCAIRTSIARDLGGPHLSIIQGGPEFEVLFLSLEDERSFGESSIEEIEDKHESDENNTETQKKLGIDINMIGAREETLGKTRSETK